ncbi:MAG: sigma-70 family RNA polymerase sigma factor [Solirubrobacteraceae bacterium]
MSSLTGSRHPDSLQSAATLGAISDEELVSLLRGGSDRAFEILAARYHARLLRFCASMLRSREDAEDALQDVLISALRALRADDRQINVRPWLYQIARNRCINNLRSAQRVRLELLDDQQPQGGRSVVESISDREEFRTLVADVRALPEAQSAALLLREFDGYAYEQIAATMDTTVSGVKSLLFRARAGLRASSATRAARPATCCAAQRPEHRAACTVAYHAARERSDPAALSHAAAAVAA